jgi:hypothetical protein
MKIGISNLDDLLESVGLARLSRVNEMIDNVSVQGEWDVKVVRADGSIERKTLKNIVTRPGLNRIAHRAVAHDTSPFFYIAIGTVTAAASLDSTQAGLGEVKRKVSAVGSTQAQSSEWIFLQCTFGGAADSVASLVLDSAGISDGVNSSASVGILGNQVNGIGVTLANSDLLDLTVRIRVGSHNGTHTT